MGGKEKLKKNYKLELNLSGNDREVVLHYWNEMFRMGTYSNDLWNVLKNVCK